MSYSVKTTASVSNRVIPDGTEPKYLFRAIDKHGRLIDFMLSDRRNTKAARRFLAKALKLRTTLLSP